MSFDDFMTHEWVMFKNSKTVKAVLALVVASTGAFVQGKFAGTETLSVKEWLFALLMAVIALTLRHALAGIEAKVDFSKLPGGETLKESLEKTVEKAAEKADDVAGEAGDTIRRVGALLLAASLALSLSGCASGMIKASAIKETCAGIKKRHDAYVKADATSDRYKGPTGEIQRAADLRDTELLERLIKEAAPDEEEKAKP